MLVDNPSFIVPSTSALEFRARIWVYYGSSVGDYTAGEWEGTAREHRAYSWYLFPKK